MKIFCVGRNYPAHASELKNEIPQEPVIFIKPESALVKGNDPVAIPEFTNDLQYELEVVLRIGKEGKNLNAVRANEYFSEWTVGIDFTARDIQNELKSKGLPWELAKAFDGAALVGGFIPIAEQMNQADFELKRNQRTVQKGNTAHMLFPFEYLVSFISRYFRLTPGDLIFTGTPSGVGKVSPGDQLSGYLNGSCLLDVRMDG